MIIRSKVPLRAFDMIALSFCLGIPNLSSSEQYRYKVDFFKVLIIPYLLTVLLNLDIHSPILSLRNDL